jgi:O-antigen/teichoic acid export membrane protein
MKIVDICKKFRTVSEKIGGKLTRDDRNRKAALTGVITLFVKGVSLGSGLLSIPITAQYLGKEQFGVWLLLSMFMNWISLADLGLTNSLVNTLSTAIATGDRRIARQSVSSAFFPMVFLGIFLLSSSIVSSFFIPWEQILNIRLSSSLQQDTRLSISVAMCFFAIKIPLSIPRCIYTAYQKGYIYQLWIGLANILSLVSLLIAQHYHANLPWLLSAFFGVVIIGDFLAGVDIFYFRQQWLRPKLTNCNAILFKDLIRVGFQFWIAQICAICIFQTDLIVVSQLFGVVEVGTYGVLLRLFSIIDGVSSSFITPLWPAYSDAQARYDYKWINNTFRNSMIIALVWSVVAGSMLVSFSPILLRYLVGKDVLILPELPLYMLLTYVLLSIAQCIGMLVNGLGRLKLQSFVAPVSAFTNVGLSIWLGKTIGIQGVTLATSICLLIFSVLLVGGDSILGMKQIGVNSNKE